MSLMPCAYNLAIKCARHISTVDE